MGAGGVVKGPGGGNVIGGVGPPSANFDIWLQVSRSCSVPRFIKHSLLLILSPRLIDTFFPLSRRPVMRL